jgi:hypothetical protein
MSPTKLNVNEKNVDLPICFSKEHKSKSKSLKLYFSLRFINTEDVVQQEVELHGISIFSKLVFYT